MIELFALIQNPILLPLPAGGEGVGGVGLIAAFVQRQPFHIAWERWESPIHLRLSAFICGF
jgi:hypothetical protein